ncbi:hypothetical protein ACFV2X_43105 [Streptomyces sp. NPDC059679]|uniref:hypothetical protein n=1 Tax=Streptomyces sp. NPDC059679 TaxID=3346903 RepID=UPI0036C481E4
MLPASAVDDARCPAVGQLHLLVKKVLADPEISRSKSLTNQVRWVEKTLMLALAREDFRTYYGQSLRDLLGPGAAAVCRLTEEGELRLAQLDTDPKNVLSSQRRRSSILRRLAAAADVPSGAKSYPKPPPKPTLPSWARSELHSRLEKEVEARPSDPGRARLLVVIGLVLDTAARAGELCSVDIEDLAPDLSWVKITRNPQADASDARATEVWPLSPITQAAVANWLPIRARLTEELEGGARALLVVLTGNRGPNGHGIYKKGMPLRPHGLADAYRAHVKALKAEVTNRGEAGWELPQRMEQLRRGVQERRSQYATGRREGAKTPKWGPAVVLGPLHDGKKTAAAFAKAVQAVDALHQARTAAGDETDPKVTRARRTLREATRAAWARSDHATVLKLLRQAKLATDDLAAAGYQEELLDALERS